MATQIFISYRREGGIRLAMHIYDRLQNEGYDCFLDKHTLKPGKKFTEEIYTNINKCTDFLLVLPPGGLDKCKDEEDWVRKEIEYALEKNKHIIPFLEQNFEFPQKADLPEKLRVILDLEVIKFNDDYLEAVMEKLKDSLYSKPTKNLVDNEVAQIQTNNKNISAFIKVVPIIIICIIAYFLLPKTHNPAVNVSGGITGSITIGSEDETSIEDRLKANPVEQITLGAQEDSGEDTPKTFEDYLAAAENGDLDAMLNVAACYYKGEGVAQDLNKGFKWCLKSAEADNPAGMTAVAMMYSGGLGVEKDKNTARKWFTEAYEVFMKDSEIDLEDDGDMIGLGMFYLMKYFSDIDAKESGENAFKWFKKAADTDVISLSSGGFDSYYAKICTGICYIEGIGTSPNYDKALELFNDVSKDYIEFQIYRISRDAIDPEPFKYPNNNPSKDIAKFLIGYCYAEGKGVPQDYKKAFEYFMEAANANVTEAMANIGAYYWQGKGVEKDYDQAFYWCLKAAEAGNVTAMNTVGKIYYLDSGSHKDYERAVFWFEKAANALNVDAMKNLAIMYKNGEGVAKNLKKSKEWQQKYEQLQKSFSHLKAFKESS